MSMSMSMRWVLIAIDREGVLVSSIAREDKEDILTLGAESGLEQGYGSRADARDTLAAYGRLVCPGVTFYITEPS